MQRVAQLGVDGVISDDPDLLRKTLGGLEKELFTTKARSHGEMQEIFAADFR